MEDVVKYLKKAAKAKKRILITGHPHADPDAAGSIFALEDTLSKLGAKVTIGVPNSIAQMTKSLLKSTQRKLPINPDIDVDVVVMVDTSTLDQLEELGEKIKEKKLDLIVIDHHRPSKGLKRQAKFYYVNEKASSTAEIILKIIDKLGGKVTPEVAKVLLAGVISDTGQFRFASDDTFRAVNRLLESGTEYTKVLRAMDTPDDPSKRVAMLKAAQRAELHKAHGRWIVFSEIGTFEGDAASMFVKIGADIAIVGSEENENKVRLSGRSRSGIVAETHLHLGEMMEKLAEEFNGTGGGHAGAAATNVKASLPVVKEMALKLLRKMLEPKSKNE